MLRNRISLVQLLLLAFVASIVFSGCKKENSIDKKILVSKLFQAGMSSEQNLKSSIQIYNTGTNKISGCSGGYIEVNTTITGTLDDNGTGTIFLNATETLSDFTLKDSTGTVYTCNGAPYISLTGTLPYSYGTLSSTARMSIGGAFTIKGKNCNETIDYELSININNAGTGGDVSGTIDGKSVYFSF